MIKENARILWEPSLEKVRHSNVLAFAKFFQEEWGFDTTDFSSLWQLSVEESEKFWQSLIRFSNIKAETWGTKVLENPNKMPGAVWFPEAKLNYAENLLFRDDSADALVFWGEDKVKERFSHKELYEEVSRLALAMKNIGVGLGDRVAGYMPNMPETIIAMLATSSIGAIWSSCSPDFGVQGVLDRFGQIKPKLLFVTNGYYYNGKEHDILEKSCRIVKELQSVEKVIVTPYLRSIQSFDVIRDSILWNDFIRSFPAQEIEFVQLPFNHPLYIMYSSGTTGVPKCIVHGAGGTLLKHVSEHLLHSDEKQGDRVFYFSTCGWMMWNWLISALCCKATLLLYDGSPFYPDPNILFDFAQEEKMTHFGTSAKYIDALKKSQIKPILSHDLAALKSMMSTGSPLVSESFDYVYNSIKTDLHLASISGGTDIVGCFVLGNPIGPVWRGEIQTRALGLSVDVFDEDGEALVSKAGDLVCTRPFPSMPVSFWGDENGAKYKSAYFDKYPNVWCHGDWVELTERGGMIIFGRSDATLNPGGVRIGTAEIYRQVEQFEEITEGLCVGQSWDGDVRIVLFVVMKDNTELTDEIRDRIRERIGKNCTVRHIPAIILPVPDIPRTRSGKITELAVRNIIEGRPVKNVEALANPDSLEFYRYLPDLAK